MTVLSFDAKKIKKLILSGAYEKAAEIIFDIIENQENADNELVFEALNLLNLICDKSPSISLRTVKNISDTINEPNSWIRLVSLEILYQIALYRPNLLIDLMDKVRSRYYDNEPTVRRLAVKIIGTLILSLHIDVEKLHVIIEEFLEKLMDEDWKVKLRVIETLKKILNQNYTLIPDLEPLLSIVIINLRDEDDDVARSAAELLKILGVFFLSKEKIIHVLLNLLHNEDARVKELIIWLFGEIGKEKSSEIIPIIPKLINLLEGSDYRIQLRVIDALVSISENNFDQIWANLINSLDTSEIDFRNTIINALYYLSQNNITEIFSYLFEELESPSENIRDGIALVFKRLFEEYQVEIENEITKILYQLDSKYWRERKKAIILLRNICLILESKKIAVWIFIEFDRILDEESDPDVRSEIFYTLNSIETNYKDIDEIIQKVKADLSLINDKIFEFQKKPAQFREKMNSYINDFRFRDTEAQLNKIYRKILNDIKGFNRKINNFEYKRLAFSLIEDWEETKIQVIDELSIIKGFISDIYEEKKVEYTLDLKSQIKVLEDRINVLRAQFEYIMEYEFPDDISQELQKEDRDEELEDKFWQVSQLRDYLFKLDDDIRDLLVNNVEFDIFKDLLSKWVGAKIEIQEYLSDFDRKIKSMKDKIIKYFVEAGDSEEPPEVEKISGIKNELGFQLIQGHIQSIITQGIEAFKKYNENFSKLNEKIEFLISNNEFSDVKKLIEMTTKQIQSTIESYERQIDTIIGKIVEDNVFNLYVRPYINKFVGSKELLINKMKNFNQKSNDKLHLAQIIYYLEVMSPIKLEKLSNYIDLDIEALKDLILKYINKNKLNARVVNDLLYSNRLEDEILDTKDLLFFKNIKTIGNKMFLNFKLNNPTNLIFKELQISLKTPSYLNFMKKESFPRYLFIPELKSGSVFKFNYVLKIDKNIERNLFDSSADEIALNLYYKDPFDVNRKISKKIDLLLP